jgi:hypothetical protein
LDIQHNKLLTPKRTRYYSVHIRLFAQFLLVSIICCADCPIDIFFSNNTQQDEYYESHVWSFVTETGSTCNLNFKQLMFIRNFLQFIDGIIDFTYMIFIISIRAEILKPKRAWADLYCSFLESRRVVWYIGTFILAWRFETFRFLWNINKIHVFQYGSSNTGRR